MKPVVSSLPELSDGVMIVVQGTMEKEEDGKCMLDFGHSMKTTTALRICVTFASQIELSLQVDEGKGFSFRRGFLRADVLRFEVIVLVSDGNFKISLNGCHVCEAPYQMSLKEVNCLEVTGSILLHRIFCQQPCHADQQVNGDHKASKKVSDTLGINLPESEVPAESVVHKDQHDPEIGQSDSKPPKSPSVGTDASSKPNLSKSNGSTKVGESSVSEADVLHDVELTGRCLEFGSSVGDTPKSDTNALDAACWSSQNPSIPGQSERPGSCMTSESLQTLTTSDRIELPYAYPSPEAPAVPASSAGPHTPTGYEFAQNPLVQNCLDATCNSAQYPQFQNRVMVDPSNPQPYPPYPEPAINQNAGNLNAPYPYPGYAYQPNPVIPGQWNAPYPLPGNTPGQMPVPSSQLAAPLPTYPYPGYTARLYPPLPSVSAAPYLHSGHGTQQPNTGIPSYRSHPPFNPEYSAPAWPNYNQRPATDAMRTSPSWTHSNMRFFPEGLRLNQVINIYGEFLQNPSGFSLLISNGETEEANVFLNMVVSFPDRMVSRSRKMYSRWSQMENSLSHFPFQAGKPFHIAVVCCYNLFRVFGNEAHLFDFQATMNLSEVTSAKVFGMVAAVNISVS